MAQQNKTLYHSELVKSGTVEAQIMSDVTQSKHRGKPPYVEMKIDGKQRYYNTENEACERALEGLKGCWVQITATGSRDDAEISVTTDRGAPVDRRGGGGQRGYDEEPPTRGRREEEPPPRRETRREAPADRERHREETQAEKEAREFGALSRAKVYAAKVRILWTVAWKHAEIAIEEAFSQEEIDGCTAPELLDLQLRIAATILIETKNVTDINELPVKWPKAAPEPKPPKEEKPKPPPQPPATPDDDEIPF